MSPFKMTAGLAFAASCCRVGVEKRAVPVSIGPGVIGCMFRIISPARSAAAAVRRLSNAAQDGGGGSNAPSSKPHDSRPQETFFGLPPPGFDTTTHFGFQTVAQELKEGLVAQV